MVQRLRNTELRTRMKVKMEAKMVWRTIASQRGTRSAKRNYRTNSKLLTKRFEKAEQEALDWLDKNQMAEKDAIEANRKDFADSSSSHLPHSGGAWNESYTYGDESGDFPSMSGNLFVCWTLKSANSSGVTLPTQRTRDLLLL